MGGFGSGGSRSGAGRKKKAKHLRIIDGGAGRRGDVAAEDIQDAPDAAAAELVDPPADMRPSELAIWSDLAPRARLEGTLTASTRDNFARLCQLEADFRELRARYLPQLDAEGRELRLLRMGSKEELALRRECRNLAKDIHARMKDFKIAPFGKELEPAGGGLPVRDALDEFTRGAGA